MGRAHSNRRMPRQHLMLHHRAHGAPIKPVRTSDFVLALLGVVLLGGLALAAAYALAAGAPAR